jgi:putative membrane protein
MGLGLIALFAAILSAPRIAAAHDLAPTGPDELWSAWNVDLLVLASLVAAGWAYRRGVLALWARAGRGRGVRGWQALCFAVGLLAVFVALVSPLDRLSLALFSAHMTQHVLLVLVAAPLLVLGQPATAFLWVLPLNTRRGVGRWWRQAAGARRVWFILSAPVVAWVLHASATWVWHLPGLYEAALTSRLLHIVEHIAFLGTAALFWWAIAHAGARGQMGHGAAILYVFTMMMQGGLLGALMTFSGRPWYAAYASTVEVWGLTPTEDQQLAGLIMWIPASLTYLVAALILMAVWLHEAERQVRRNEALPPNTKRQAFAAKGGHE